MLFKAYILSFFTLLLFGSLKAGEGVTYDHSAGLAADSDFRSIDKLYYVDKQQDTTRRTQNPTRALFKSLLFPGAGQFDNKSYIKGTLVFSCEILLIGAVVHYSKKANSALREFERAKEIREGTALWGSGTIPYGTQSVGDAEYDRLFDEYQDARNEQNLFRWYLGVFVFLSMFDAFVDAHLAQFPKYDKKISFDVGSDEENMVMVKLSYNLW